MNFNSLINSRHREQTIKDLLNLGGNVEQDHLSIPQIEKMFSVPSTGDFEFGCDVTMSKSCTYNDERLFSYRKSKITGRFISLIWFKS